MSYFNKVKLLFMIFIDVKVSEMPIWIILKYNKLIHRIRNIY